MDRLQRTPNALLSCWSCYDWRESFFAPGFPILQALTHDGKTASGAGESREEAFQRCLGETAEWAALAHARKARPTLAFDSRVDGIAAHPDSALARSLALHEAIERHVVTLWWLGRRPARPLPDAWLTRRGLLAELSRLRYGASLRRETRFFTLGRLEGTETVLCVSQSPGGQCLVPGYGTAPTGELAAAKAMREMLLMELRLMEGMANQLGQPADPEGLSDPLGAAQSAALAERLGRDTPDLPEADRWPTRVDFEEITPPDGPLSVWICRPGHTGPRLDPDAPSPFL